MTVSDGAASGRCRRTGDDRMRFGDRYYEFMLAADIEGAWSFLGALGDGERREAKAWFERSRVALLDRVFRDFREAHPNLTDTVTFSTAPWVLALGPISLLGPVTAAQKIPWGRMWWFSKDDRAESFVIARLAEKDRAWVEAFVAEASAARVGDMGQTVARVVRAVATHHGLGCPPGDTFLEHWTAGVPVMNGGWDQATRSVVRDPVAWLSSDPFMPDLLLRYLASGHCGSSDWLPETLPVLVERGVVDRDEVVQQVLVQLTAPQRPASQKVLVKILEALELKAVEVSGGCAYFLGVIATSKGVVGKLFLPMALETLTSADDLAELTAIIAGRSEKAQKTVLLNALKRQQLHERVGLDAVRDALDVLGAGDDAAFDLKVRAVLDKLPGTPPAPAAATEDPQGSGLWELAPTPSGAPRAYWHQPGDPGWADVVDSRAFAAGYRRDDLVEVVLERMEGGTFDAEASVAELTAIMSGARLSVSMTISVLRDVFLAGGLRQGYPVALRLTEAAAGFKTRPAGLADLLRLLAEFSVEIPPAERPAMPAALTAVAASPSSTKARAEARVLGARLAGESLETYVAGLEAAAPAAPVVRRGLWKEPAGSTLAETRLPAVDGSLARRLVDPQHAWWSERDVTGGFTTQHVARDPAQVPGLAFCGPDLLVAAVVRRVIPAGARKARKAVRELLAEAPPSHARPEVAVLALQEWARGIGPERFWQLALAARTAQEVYREYQPWLRTAPEEERREAHRRFFGAEGLVVYDGTGPDGRPIGTVLSVSLNVPAARLELLRALEVLLLSEVNPVVLATPVWADGTLDLDTLLDRLRAVDRRPVGPLDLVQSLHRLRPCDPARARDVEELARSGGSWRTSPELTTPDGRESWDVLEVVRTWVAAGGLPPLEPELTAEGHWSTRTLAPVSWASCAAAPAELRAGDWAVGMPGQVVPSARVFPLWPDRAVAGTAWHRSNGSIGFPAEMSGPFGPPLHRALVGMLVHGIDRRDAASLAAACRAARRGKIEPGLFEAAVVTATDEGNLKVGRLAQATQHLFEQGALAQFWDAALGATAALATRPGPPANGLAQLVEVLTAYVHEVPEPSVPPGLRSVVDGGGRTRYHRAVAALVDALESGASR